MYKTTTRNKSKVTNAYPSIPSSILKADCYPFNPDGLRNVSFNIVFLYQMFTRMNDDSIKSILLKLISQSCNGYGSKLFSSVE